MARKEVTRRQFMQAGSIGTAALFLQSHLFPNLSAAEVAGPPSPLKP